MSDLIRREDATAVIRKTLGSLGNSVVTEINSLSGYVTQDYARFTQESTQDLIKREDIEWHQMMVADGDGMYHEEDVAYRSQIESLPSAEPPYQYSKAYVEQIRGERDIL